MPIHVSLKLVQGKGREVVRSEAKRRVVFSMARRRSTGRWVFPFGFFLLSLFVLSFQCLGHHEVGVVMEQESVFSNTNGKTQVPVGVILDLGTWIGNVSWRCINMAIDDFYLAHPNYSTRLFLHLRDTDNTSVSAASAALDLLNNVGVQAIIGPQTSTQAKFVMGLGNKSQVPVVTFSAKSPSLSPAKSQYFIRTGLNDSSQAKAIASLVKSFKWRQAIPVFEDSEYGNGIIPYLIDELQENDVSVPYRSKLPLSATKDQIMEELHKLKTMQTRVFVVHMTYNLGSILLKNVKEAGMLEDGYVWIITYGLTDIFDFMQPSLIYDMQGILGVKPYFRESTKLSVFKLRWRKESLRKHPNSNASEPSAFGLWAYDTVYALAQAIERVEIPVSSFRPIETINSSSSLSSLVHSPIGQKLLTSILKVSFNGLTGRFHLIDGQLQTSNLEIINVNGSGTRRVGFWTPEHGISRHITSKADLKSIIWPGGSNSVPRGWEWPTAEKKKLRIGVPVKPGFSEFIDMDRDPITNRSIGNYRGFSVHVFDAVMKSLKYKVDYEYVPFEDSKGQSNGSYDDLVYQVYLQNFDAVVGDVTIITNRSLYVDFTLPYTEAGVTMVVPVRDYSSKSALTFLKPMTTGLWVTSVIFFILTGFVVWVFEHRISEEFRGSPLQQLSTIFYFSFSTLVFKHREKLSSNYSRIVVVIWTFVVLILTSSYRASLTSMLTVQRLQPTLNGIDELLLRGYNVGYLNDSFLPALLQKLKFDSSKLIPYNSPEEYAEGMSKGSSNGGVAAVIDEIPYINVFLSRYCGKYMMVGPTYHTNGFGFVFPKGSPLVPDVSRAILSLTEGKDFEKIKQDLYAGRKICEEQIIDVASTSLTLNSFWGLFLITGLTSTCAVIGFMIRFFYKNHDELARLSSGMSLWQKVLLTFIFYLQKKDLSSPAFKDEHTEKEPMEIVPADMLACCNDPNFRSPSSFSNHTYGNFEQDDGFATPPEGDEPSSTTVNAAHHYRSSLSFADMPNERTT